MSNTQLRVISALVMAMIVVGCLLLGPKVTLAFLLVAGLLSVDEIYCNFYSKPRFAPSYFLAQGVFACIFVYFNYIFVMPWAFNIFVLMAVFLNVLFLYYLFFTHIDSESFINIIAKFPASSGIIFLLPFMSLARIMQTEQWISWVVVLLIINFGMDTGAWFFGKNFGKRKLWPSVSPKKTVEGLVGGMFTSSLFGGLAYYFLFKDSSIIVWPLFFVLGGISQLGDLIQSKLKRQFGIKDSSSLIPGHGGVYDRIDSLLFLSPFFALALHLTGRV